MSYEVLARKWRPRIFADVAAQDHVVRALTNALDNDRVHHAFLFTGTRGVGKTTLARIFAKSLNCEAGVSSTPCGECSACLDIDAGRFVDMLEMDAASRTGIDDIREVLDNVQYAPGRGRYKVYLIDEVHMLSKPAFNALLKTLEEPPPHVKFLLATTDPQKVPVTVLSRCIQFQLKRVSVALIEAHLEKIVAAESVQTEPGSLLLIARAADGSLRDALSLLDQAIAFGNGSLASADVVSMLGEIDSGIAAKLVEAICVGQRETLVSLMDQLVQQTADFSVVLERIAGLLHRVALVQQLPEAAHGEHDHDADSIKRLAGIMPAELVQLYYEIILRGSRDLDLAPDRQIGFEMTVLRMLAFKPGDGQSEPVAEMAKPVTRQAPPPANEPSSQSKPPATATAVNDAPTQSVPERNRDLTDWASVVPALGVSGMALQVAKHSLAPTIEGSCVLLPVTADGKVMARGAAIDRLAEALSRFLGRKVSVKILDASETPGGESAGTPQTTPAQKEHADKSERHRQAKESLLADPNVQQLTEQFGAVLNEDSIKPLDAA